MPADWNPADWMMDILSGQNLEQSLCRTGLKIIQHQIRLPKMQPWNLLVWALEDMLFWIVGRSQNAVFAVRIPVSEIPAKLFERHRPAHNLWYS